MRWCVSVCVCVRLCVCDGVCVCVIPLREDVAVPVAPLS